MRKLLIAIPVAILAVGLVTSGNAAPNMTPQSGGAGRTVQWHPGVSAHELESARIVRIPPGFRAADLATLRDDQMIETPSGKRVSVSKIRAIRQAIAQAEARPRAPGPFQILPPPTKPCTLPRAGETYAQIVARRGTDVICMRSGASVSVAQLRLMKAYVERTHSVNLSDVVPVVPSGPAVTVANPAQLTTLLYTKLKDAPDSTVLVNPKGERITLGSARAAVKAKPTKPRVKESFLRRKFICYPFKE